MSEQLAKYFSDGIAPLTERRVGIEVETHFIQADFKEYDAAIPRRESQALFEALCKSGWECVARRGGMLSALKNQRGDLIQYDLGAHVIELSAVPASPETAVAEVRAQLKRIYRVAARRYPTICPLFEPLVHDKVELAMPDERDATWLKLDGRPALENLARTAAVQFTVDVTADEAIPALNRLGAAIDRFLEDYPQDRIWRQYIAQSKAGYDPSRYGGPLEFDNLWDYCWGLSQHEVVQNGKLVPFREASRQPEFDIPLFLRSVWWYFRLRRYGNRLCIEVRPLPRRSDADLGRQLQMVLDIMDLPKL